MMFQLYIDPGTGSMLFSVIIGLLAALYFVAKAVWIKLKFLVSGRKGVASGQAFVIYSEGTQYWNVFEPVAGEFERRKIPLAFYTSSKDDPVFSRNYCFVKPEYIGSGNKAFARLNFLEADVCLMTTPGLDVYQLKRSKNVKHYAHILHSVADVSMYRLFGTDYFDSILLTGQYEERDIRSLEKQRGLPAKELPVIGCTYLDVLREKQTAILNAVSEKRPFTVLVSPSWGVAGLLSKYGEKLLEPLILPGWHIIIRPHPQSRKSEAKMLESLQQKYPESQTITWDYNPENLETLSRSDIMISDFSGIIFDYVFLFDRPFLYVNQNFDLRPYDADDLETPPWIFSELSKIGREITEAEFPAIRSIIEETIASPQIKENRATARAAAWQYPGESGMRAADFLIEKRSQLTAL